MGLDATVMCNCYRDGKTSPPPFLRDWLEVDDEGYLNLKKEHDNDDNWHTFYQWEQDCCEHHRMEYADERIANWTGYRLFRQALGEVGWEHFPVMLDQLPSGNGGLMESIMCEQALRELDYLVAKEVIGIKTVLADTGTGEEIWEHVSAYEGVMIMSGTRGFNAGLGEFEFFAIDSDSDEELFRATRLRQFRQDGHEITQHGHGICWENLDTGEVFASGMAIGRQAIPWEDGSWTNAQGQYRYRYPREFHVERRPWLVSDLDFIMTALRNVFTASVETGNPVRWC